MNDREIELSPYREIDKALLNVEREVKLTYYLEPLNEKQRKEEFLKSKQEPKFVYKEIAYDQKEVEDKLAREVPDKVPELATIYNNKKQELGLMHEMIKRRGDSDFIMQASSEIYGTPNEDVIDYAITLVRDIPPIDGPKNVPAEHVRKVMEEEVREYGLELAIDRVDELREILDKDGFEMLMDYLNARNRRYLDGFMEKVERTGNDRLKEAVYKFWIIGRGRKYLTTVYPAEKNITVCGRRKFAEGDAERLAVHEIGVHALRAANGYEQPLAIFAMGLDGYERTEEGLAVFFEEKTGHASKEVLRDYAGRVIAVSSLLQGMNFRQTFDRLKDYKFSDEQAWKLSLRAYRGGGFVKDHIYLAGLLDMREYEKNGGDFEILYVGKIGLHHIPLVKRLIEKGIVKKPKYRAMLT
ncbi:MAG: hypothetical protein DRP03_02570 [Candidatus Aenigmatarchaeota archaeon]|nr:MAG: hypothetical protein DRP03_02570 [Candidatus Aenigmarchaeota archaeon]